jgi:hypothetical protein
MKEYLIMQEEMSYKQSNNAKLIEAFIVSGYPICRVDFDKEAYIKPGSFASSLQMSAKRYGRPHVRVLTRNGEVYMINKLKG